LRLLAQQPLERVKIPSFGRSLSLVGLTALAIAAPLRAQDARPAPPPTHTVKRGDTLWDIAKTYFGDPYLWPSIYRLNTNQIEDPHWIYPGEVLKLPGERAPAATVAVQPVIQAPAPTTTVFSTPRTERSESNRNVVATPRPRVTPGDFLRAAYLGPDRGPSGAGKVLFGADIPGIDLDRSRTNFQMYDRLLIAPPVGSVAAERERFLAYTLGDYIEGFGTIVIPTALLEVVRAPRNGEAATVEVRELYGMLNADTPVIPIDTNGIGGVVPPIPISDGRTTEILSIYRSAVLPSLNYDVLFGLTSRDGMHVGDEVVIFRPREKSTEEYPALPEVPIATGQVVRVTPYGSTARITSQVQPAIRVGESVRVTAKVQ
jgi:LysM repeat protein